MPKNFLKQIVTSKTLQKSECSFAKALKGKGVSLIAEIKKASPSRGVIFKGKFDVAKIAKSYEMAGASAISVLTDEKFFQGSFDNLALARAATKNTPLLCKDFIAHEYQIFKAREYGADAILLIAAILEMAEIRRFIKVAKSLGMDCLVEVHNENDLEKALKVGAKIIGINNRDLKTFKIDMGISDRLTPKIPRGKLIVVESGIQSRADIEGLDKRVNAVLVGTSIMCSKNISEKVRELTNNKS